MNILDIFLNSLLLIITFNLLPWFFSYNILEIKYKNQEICYAKENSLELINAIHPTAYLMEDVLIKENVILHGSLERIISAVPTVTPHIRGVSAQIESVYDTYYTPEVEAESPEVETD